MKTFLLALFILIVGCSPVPRTMTLRIPHMRQEQNLCVPTSAAMVLAYYGDDITPRQLKELAGYREDFEGTYFSDMIAGLEKIGYKWQAKGFDLDHAGFEIGMQEIIRNIVDKRPVLVSTSSDEIGHTMVVVGYDNVRKVVELMDPASTGSRTISYEKFESVWHEVTAFKNSNRWILVTWPKQPQ